MVGQERPVQEWSQTAGLLEAGRLVFCKESILFIYSRDERVALESLCFWKLEWLHVKGDHVRAMLMRQSKPARRRQMRKALRLLRFLICTTRYDLETASLKHCSFPIHTERSGPLFHRSFKIGTNFELGTRNGRRYWQFVASGPAYASW
jgi:hypothetical protein